MTKKKASEDYTLMKKRSGRYAVIGKNGKFINGDAKTEILLKEKAIKPPPTKKKSEPATEK